MDFLERRIPMTFYMTIYLCEFLKVQLLLFTSMVDESYNHLFSIFFPDLAYQKLLKSVYF